MDIKIIKIPLVERKLKAVIGEAKAGIFLPTPNGKVYWLSAGGLITEEAGTLESNLRDSSQRTGIYEGDSITLTF
jgi:hypothetical protein